MRKALLVTAALASVAIAVLAALSTRSTLASSRPKPTKAEAAREAQATAAANASKTKLALQEKAKDDALRFARAAQTGCQELERKTEALSASAVIDASKLDGFIPAEIYPTDAFATYVGEATFADVKTQLSQMVTALVEMLRTLSRNELASIGIEQEPGAVDRQRTTFQEKKLKALTSLATYCETVRRAGAGVGALR